MEDGCITPFGVVDADLWCRTEGNFGTTGVTFRALVFCAHTDVLQLALALGDPSGAVTLSWRTREPGASTRSPRGEAFS